MYNIGIHVVKIYIIESNKINQLHKKTYCLTVKKLKQICLRIKSLFDLSIFCSFSIIKVKIVFLVRLSLRLIKILRINEKVSYK